MTKKKSHLASTVTAANRNVLDLKEIQRKEQELEKEYKAIDVLLFHPFEPFRIRWDFLVMGVMMYIIIDIPYTLAFEANYNAWAEIWIDCFLMFDIVMNFNTGFMGENDQIITKRRAIVQKYLHGWFWIDLVTSFPYGLILNMVDSASSAVIFTIPKFLRITKIFRMIKVLRVFKLYQAMSQWEILDGAGYSAGLRLGKFLVVVFVLAHVAACVLMGITCYYLKKLLSPLPSQYNGKARVTGDGSGFCWDQHNPMARTNAGDDYASLEWHPSSWISMDGGLWDGHNRLQTYLFTLYWSFTTLTTVGYGDIAAHLPLEIIWTIVVEMFGTSLFGYIIGNVASVITHEDETAVLIKTKIQSIVAYMKYRQFPPALAEKIRRHYEYSWKRTQVYNEEEILRQLPTTVRTEVALHIHHDTLRKVPFLRQLGEDVIPLLVVKLRPINCSPRDIVIKEDYFGEEMYFVTDGALKVFLGGGQVRVTPATTRVKRGSRGSIRLMSRGSTVNNLFGGNNRQATLKGLNEMAKGGSTRAGFGKSASARSIKFTRFLSRLSRMHSSNGGEDDEGGAPGPGNGGGGEVFRELEIHVENIQKGDYFAEYTLILRCAKHPVSVRALSYCDLFSLSKADFEELCERVPSVYEQVMAVGRRRYVLLMQALERKRLWADAARTRGAPLGDIEGHRGSLGSFLGAAAADGDGDDWGGGAADGPGGGRWSRAAQGAGALPAGRVLGVLGRLRAKRRLRRALRDRHALTLAALRRAQTQRSLRLNGVTDKSSSSHHAEGYAMTENSPHSSTRKTPLSKPGAGILKKVAARTKKPKIVSGTTCSVTVSKLVADDLVFSEDDSACGAKEISGRSKAGLSKVRHFSSKLNSSLSFNKNNNKSYSRLASSSSSTVRERSTKRSFAEKSRSSRRDQYCSAPEGKNSCRRSSYLAATLPPVSSPDHSGRETEEGGRGPSWSAAVAVSGRNGTAEAQGSVSEKVEGMHCGSGGGKDRGSCDSSSSTRGPGRRGTQGGNIQGLDAKRGKLTIHMLARIKMWKNRSVMRVALRNMDQLESQHRSRMGGGGGGHPSPGVPCLGAAAGSGLEGNTEQQQTDALYSLHQQSHQSLPCNLQQQSCKTCSTEKEPLLERQDDMEHRIENMEGVLIRLCQKTDATHQGLSRVTELLENLIVRTGPAAVNIEIGTEKEVVMTTQQVFAATLPHHVEMITNVKQQQEKGEEGESTNIRRFTSSSQERQGAERRKSSHTDANHTDTTYENNGCAPQQQVQPTEKRENGANENIYAHAPKQAAIAFPHCAVASTSFQRSLSIEEVPDLIEEQVI